MPTATVTPTPTPATFIAEHDGFTDNLLPTQNFGALSSLFTRASSGSFRFGYFKFAVAGLSGGVRSATLRLYVVDGTAGSGSVYPASNDFSTGGAWTENALVWDNQPAVIGPMLTSFSGLPSGTDRDFDVTAAVTGNGTFSFLLRTLTADQAEFATHEATLAQQRPRLIIVPVP